MSSVSRSTMGRGDLGGRWRASEGAYVKTLRNAAGLTQQQVADGMECDNKTMISHIETGRVRVPPDWYEDMSEVLGIEAKEFVTTILRWHDPFAYAILFGADAELQAELIEGSPRLQAKAERTKLSKRKAK